ncbi:hypothetical protein CEXT_95681 [Caerostris extrusa]|uniref:Uncharacterized protein n=1 Tax=Caerostris extrusa TaxID=172846 RepID=A0AAV4TSY0_CAEEX|nr:hypothetical protein CEXT_95681 [Caerostris extrusa]
MRSGNSNSLERHRQVNIPAERVGWGSTTFCATAKEETNKHQEKFRNGGLRCKSAARQLKAKGGQGRWASCRGNSGRKEPR